MSVIVRRSILYLVLWACSAPAPPNAQGARVGKSEVGAEIGPVPVLYLQTLSPETTARLRTDHEDPPVALVSFPELLEAARSRVGLAQRHDDPEIAGAGEYAIALPFFFVLGKVGGGAALGTSMAAAGEFLGGALIGLSLTWAASETLQRVVRVEAEDLGSFDVVGTTDDFETLKQAQPVDPSRPDPSTVVSSIVLAMIINQWQMLRSTPQEAANDSARTRSQKRLPIVFVDIDDASRQLALERVYPTEEPMLESIRYAIVEVQRVLNRISPKPAVVLHSHQAVATLAIQAGNKHHSLLRDAPIPLSIGVHPTEDDIVVQALAARAATWRKNPTAYGHDWFDSFGEGKETAWLTSLNEPTFPDQPMALETYELYLATLPDCDQELAAIAIGELLYSMERVWHPKKQGRVALIVTADDRTDVPRASALPLLKKRLHMTGEEKRHRTALEQALADSIVILGNTDSVFGAANLHDLFGDGATPGDFMHAWLMQKLYWTHLENPTEFCTPGATSPVSLPVNGTAADGRS